MLYELDSNKVEDDQIPEKDFEEILTSTAPGKYFRINAGGLMHLDEGIYLNFTDLIFFCQDEYCRDFRQFKCKDRSLSIGVSQTATIIYECLNCKSHRKTFVLVFNRRKSTVIVFKLAEFPPYNEPVPSSLVELSGKFSEDLLKGKACELQNFGRAALAYYTRIADNQLHEIAVKLLIPSSLNGRVKKSKKCLKKYKKANSSDDFRRAFKKMATLLPESLLIENQNPLELLHQTLEKAGFADTDDECLEIAKMLRIILTEIAKLTEQPSITPEELKWTVAQIVK